MAMNDLPFSTELNLPREPFSGHVRLLLVPLPEGEPPSVDLALEYNGTRSVLALFGAAVNAQMFNRSDDVVSAWRADPPSIEARTFGIELQARVENLPLYAWAHLLALLRKNHDALEPLQSASITAEGAHGELPVGDVVNVVPQDLRADEPPFEWEAVGAEKSRNISLEMLFRDPVEPGVHERVEDDLSVWLQMIILGAFDLEFEEADDLDPLGTVKSTSPYRIECFVPYYTGDMSGFVALENWLRHMHRQGQALEEAGLQ
ncbi:hypothetical protein HLB44_07885 [Aquincola sp. S2]|uniref:Uncharacterized protein n=1 Tax=Pseudaquabacterium terrae TaxID=2732868 RepID=A0ABX2EE56_9BURK|nr:hypothetical protein [Aquabacterium terrae]NRF66899.1 hypothetical protein [Aquabacterium terrae]